MNEEMTPPPAVEPEHLLPAVIVGPKHQDISDDFLCKVRGIISGHVRYKLMDYGVKRARASWDSSDEFATLSLEDGSNRTLIIKLETKETAQ